MVKVANNVPGFLAGKERLLAAWLASPGGERWMAEFVPTPGEWLRTSLEGKGLLAEAVAQERELDGTRRALVVIYGCGLVEVWSDASVRFAYLQGSPWDDGNDERLQVAARGWQDLTHYPVPEYPVRREQDWWLKESIRRSGENEHLLAALCRWRDVALGLLKERNEMASFNAVTLLGNLTRDVETKYTASNLAIANFSLAVNDRVKRGEKWEDEASFFDVTAFGRTAEIAGQYLAKGSPVLVNGRLKQETWEAKDGGGKRSKVVILADKIVLVGSGKAKRDEVSQEEPASVDTYSQETGDLPF